MLNHINRKKKFQISQKLIAFGSTILVFNFYLVFSKITPQRNIFIDPLPKCKYNTEIKKSYKNEIIDFTGSFNEIQKCLRKRSIILDNGRSFTRINNKCDSNGVQFKKIAFIIPYRDREENLKKFLYNMHSILNKQKINYGIYIIEPCEQCAFNRGLILNAGFVEIIKENAKDKQLNPLGTSDIYWDCFIFHDVDMIPEDERLFYTCDKKYPLHLAVLRSSNNYSFEGYQKRYYGGINAFTYEQFTSINGFSNLYPNWGREDDDLRERVKLKYGFIAKAWPKYAKIHTDTHNVSAKNPYRIKLFKHLLTLMKKQGRALEGLNTLEYDKLAVERQYLFTKIKITYTEVEKKSLF